MSTSNSSLNIHFCVETEIQGKPWKIIKILRGRNSRLGAFFQKETSNPGKIANCPKFLDLVSTNVGLNPDIQISAGLFITAKYQRSQNQQGLAFIESRKKKLSRAVVLLRFLKRLPVQRLITRWHVLKTFLDTNVRFKAMRTENGDWFEHSILR